MEILLKKVKRKDFLVIKTLANALGFEIEKKTENSYKSEFIKEILEAEKSIKEGKGKKIKINDLWK